MAAPMSPERLESARREVVAWLACMPDSGPISPVTAAELLDEVDRQAAEIKALRLHVRVAHVHLDALGEVEITRAMVEDDALDRRLSVEPTERWTMIHGRTGDSLARLQFGSTFDPHPQLRARKWREAAVLDYANAVAAEFSIAALDVLEALAGQARADR